MNTKIHEITIPTVKGPMTVEMCSQDVIDFHDALTVYYNKHYTEITADDEEVDRVEQERNIDHANDQLVCS